MSIPQLSHSRSLDEVRYEIRGPLARRALELERKGYEVIKLNIGNPGIFGFRMPDTMRVAIIENMAASDAYCHEKGIFPAREAVVMNWQDQGITDVSADDVFIGNGVSELIVMALKGLLNPGDEVLVPSPDYPLWTAAVLMNGGKAVHYPCLPENGFEPQQADLEKLVTAKTRAIVVINPNNPSGAVYSESTMKMLAEIAEKNNLVMFSDEIYDAITYDGVEFKSMAHYARKTLCAVFSGLSKVYRACGYRVGWLSFTGEKEHAREYIASLELLAALRLCANVPGQWAVQTALGGFQSIKTLTKPGGRLYETRRVVLEACEKSPYLSVHAPAGALYAFVCVDTEKIPRFNDEEFALDLLESQHVLIAPGSSFNVPYKNYFRITLLPEDDQMEEVFKRIEIMLEEYARRK